MNNNLMPPPATVKDSTAEEKAGKNLKFIGFILIYPKTDLD